MQAEFIKIHPINPDLRKIRQVVDVLQQGGLIIYPTDTVYGIGCDIFNLKAVHRLALIKGKSKQLNLSFICYDLSHLSEYTKNVTTPVFKLMKRVLPGPYTFILHASNKVPKMLNTTKKTVGIRVPDHAIPREIVKELSHPIFSSSVIDENEPIEYSTDPELIYDRFKNLVDVVIDGGIGNSMTSTVIDYTDDEPVIVRVGAGDISFL